MSNTQLYRSIEVLPPSLQNEVADFVAFLCHKHNISITDTKQPLSAFIGTVPNLDAISFDTYLEETRNEWREPF